MNDSEAVFQDEIEVSEKYSTPNWPRRLIFEHDNHVVLQSRAPGGTTSGWHHHGDRDLYVFHLKGRMYVEHAAGGKTEIGHGKYVFRPSEETGVHRYVVPDDVDEVIGIVVFVGKGPVVVNVDDPKKGKTSFA